MMREYPFDEFPDKTSTWESVLSEVDQLKERIEELESAFREIASRADETLDDAKSSGRSTLRAILNKARQHGNK